MEEQPVTNNQIQQPPVNPVTPKPNYWLITIIVFVILLFGLSGYFLLSTAILPKGQKIAVSPSPISQPTTSPTPTPDPTANWETYTSKGSMGNISFEYPSNWYQQISTGEGNQYGGSQYEGFSNYPSYEASDYGSKEDYLTFDVKIGYSLNNKDKNRIMSDYINDLNKELKSSGRTYKEEQITTKNGADFIIYQEVGINVASYTIRAATIKNDFDYRFTLTAKSNNALDKFRPTFDQILSTLKFTDQDQIACTLDVKTCPDGSYVSRQPPTCEFAKCP